MTPMARPEIHAGLPACITAAAYRILAYDKAHDIEKPPAGEPLYDICVLSDFEWAPWVESSSLSHRH
jgi:hypothetical protein